jgi:hypothetical protein
MESWTATIALAIAAMSSSESRNPLDAPSSAAGRPPPFDLGVRVVIKLDAALRPVRPLIRVPVRDRPALELGRHRDAHRVVPRALCGSVR